MPFLLAVLSALFVSPTLSVSSFQPSGEEGKSQEASVHAAPKILKLERQSVILPKSTPRSGKRKNFYSAKLSVGDPARVFHVTFDLGGGTMVLPSESCTDKACLERRRYDRWLSSTAEDINANGQLVQAKAKKTLLRRRNGGTLGLTDMDVGTGQATGIFVRDQVCVRPEADDLSPEGEPRCFPLAMLVANKMTDMPFVLEPYDGTVGLGLKGLSVSMEFNFLSAFQRGYGYGHGGVFANSFGLHIGGDEDGGEISLGGYDLKRLTQPLQWTPVADPQEGRWQVAISAVRIGNNTFEACRDRVCRAAIDYSASLLGVPSNLASSLEAVLANTAPPTGFGNGCQHLAIPDIHLTLANDVTLTVPSEDFVNDFGSKDADASKTSCNPLVVHHSDTSSLAQDVFVLGESTLRRYYTFFNADTLSVGFSLAAGSAGKNLLSGGKTDGKKGKDTLNGEGIVLLVQVKLLRSKTISSLGA